MTKIYLLIFPDVEAFKIGKANDVFQRTTVLKRVWGQPDYSCSFSIEVDTKIAFKLEKGLHLMLYAYSMNFTEGEGKTEFFSLQALNDAIGYVNLFIKSNSLPSKLVKGIDVPQLKVKKKIKRDYYFDRHNAECKRTVRSYTETAKKLETVLRVNNLLIKYREKIKFNLEKSDSGYYTLRIYKCKFLAKALFKNLNSSHNVIQGGFVGVNFSSSLEGNDTRHKLRFKFQDSYCDSFNSSVAKDLEASFRMLEKVTKKLKLVVAN